MGLLDSVRGAVSGAVNTVRETVSTTVEKVENKAAAVAQEAKSVFDPRPSAPPPPAAPPISNNPTVSARQAALNPALLRNDLTIASGQAPEGAEAAAKALIKKHTMSLGRLQEHNLGNELKSMIEKDPANAAPILREVMKQLGSSDVDDVAGYVAQANSDSLRKLAHTPDGAAALKQMKKELSSGWEGDDDKAAYMKLDKATREAVDRDNPKLAAERKELRGASVYAANGHKEFNLDDPRAVKELIVNSPQLDNLSNTTTDGTRCGGAAILNAMLLAGDPAGNAAAIEKAATEVKVQPGISADERSALDAMKKGVMTPTDAAHLQELLVRSAKMDRNDTARGIHRSGAEGVSTQGLADFAQLLRKEGAFANAKSVTFHAEKGHWTVSVTNKAGETTGANSFPNESNGKASLEMMDGSTTFTEFSIENSGDGKAKFGIRGGMDIRGVGQLRSPPMDSGFIDPKDEKFDFPRLQQKWAGQLKDNPELMKKLIKEQGLQVDESEL